MATEVVETVPVPPTEAAVAEDPSVAETKAERKRRRAAKQEKKRLAREKKSAEGRTAGMTAAEAARAAADALVQSTNDCSIKSKRSMARKGYVTDDTFGVYFVDSKATRAPLVNRAYYARAAAVRHAVDGFLHEHKGEELQICSLGAGFDTTFFRLAESGALKRNDLFIEIDFPDLMAKKEAVINTHPDMLRWVHGSHVGPLSNADSDSSKEEGTMGAVGAQAPPGDVAEDDGRRRLVTISADLSDLPLLENLFRNHNVSPRKPTLLLSECVMTYMSPEHSSALIEWAGTFFSSSGGPGALFVVYEQTVPDDAFGTIMVRHFKKFGSPLRCISTFPSYAAYDARYRELGWTPRIVDLNAVFMSLVEEKERERVLCLEPFDEYEELHAKCAHYFLLVAVVKGSVMQREGLLDKIVGKREEGAVECGGNVTRAELSLALGVEERQLGNEWVAVRQSEEDELYQRRWGHASSQVGADRVIVVGGAGGVGHTRLNDAICIDMLKNEVAKLNTTGDPPTPRMYHSCTAWAGGILVFGGRYGPRKPYNDMYFLDASSSLWRNVETNGARPSPRWRHSATLLEDKGLLLVLGGRDSDGPVEDFAFVLDLATNVWRTLPEAPLTARYSHSATVTADGVVIVGGLAAKGLPLGDVWKLDTSSWQWTMLYNADLPEGRGGRYAHQTALIGQHLLLCVGGSMTARKGVVADVLAVFDLQEGCWRPIASDALPPLPPLPMMLFGHSMHLVSGQLVLVGGGGNCVSFGTHFNPFLTRLNLQ